MQKHCTNKHNPSRHVESAVGVPVGRKLTLLILKHLAEHKPPPPYLFGSWKKQTRKMSEMKRLGYITKNNKLACRGAYLLGEDKIWSLTIPKPKRWDKKWHMVLYDIPAKKSKQRNSFRTRLKELGLVLYQNSVWVYPYPPEKTIQAISDFYMISDCVLFAVAETLNGEQKLKRHFKLKEQ